MGILHFLFHFVISYSNGWKDNLFRVFRVSLSEATENQTNRQVRQVYILVWMVRYIFAIYIHSFGACVILVLTVSSL